VAVDHKLDIWLDVADEIRVLAPGGVVAREGLAPDGNLGCLPSYGVDIPSRPYRATYCDSYCILSHDLTHESGMAGENEGCAVNENKECAVKRDVTNPPGASLALADVSVFVKKNPLLAGVNAAFAGGRIHAILGASGSGKSTLLEAVCGFRKYEGSITLDGAEVRKIPRRELGGRAGFVFQNPQDQFVASSVYEEVMVGLKSRRDTEDRDAEVEQILRGIGLWKYRQLSPYMLSQGEQRRLAVAALLVYPCRLLICDEPTYAQDLHSLVSVMDGLKRRVDEDGLTLLFSTHDKKLARDYADHVYWLGEGGLREIDQSDL
jgi:energy-coupling factor transport system ATP-binding protein